MVEERSKFYVDPIDGSDDGDGSAQKPFRTFSRLYRELQPPRVFPKGLDVVILTICERCHGVERIRAFRAPTKN